MRQRTDKVLHKDLINNLTKIVGRENTIEEEALLKAYAHDELASREFDCIPQAVVKPVDEDGVRKVVRFCYETNVPLTARGGGTGLSASGVPSPGGIIMSLERLDRIIDVDRRNHTITAQAGVTMKSIFEEAEKADLFFPPHPGDESACVGGVVATNAGGSRAVKYGTIRHFVRGLGVVLSDGEYLRLGGKLIKSSTGYNLLGLMIGSEGTLGIITKVTFALLPKPGYLLTLVAPFGTVEEAIYSVQNFLNEGIVPCAVEFVDHTVVRCSERLLNRKWPTEEGGASLMIVLDGHNERDALGVAETIAGIMENSGALDVLIAEQKSKQQEILEIRSMIYEALRPGTAELFDICVPRSEMADHVHFIQTLEQKYRVSLPTYGHAADGNVHTHAMKTTIQDGEIGEELPNWAATHRQVKEELYKDTIQRSGVISGEHGIGLAKKDYLETNLGRVNVATMKAIKRALDPKGILNPGKIFDL